MPNPGDATMVSADAPNQTGAVHDSAFPPSPTASPVPESLRRFFNECVADRDIELPPRIPGYIVLRTIGRGATGQVFEAFHRDLRRSVAIKVLQPSSVHDSFKGSRFRAECAAAARISHPNIVEVHDCGIVDGSPFLVMELITGGSLADRLRQSPLPFSEAAQCIAALARTMSEAHRMGVIHRDLKPANVLRTEDGTVKITDFGLAKLLDESDAATATGAVLGTPAYMAPEQAASERVATPAVDIYALGAILYECLTGRPPFRAATALATVELVRSAEPIPPRRLNPAIPLDLETICLKCLSKSPVRRYASADALALDLECWLSGRPISARPIGVFERFVKWLRRHPGFGLLIAASLTTFLIGLFGVIYHVDRLRDEINRANLGELAARSESERADQNYRIARATLDEMLNSGLPNRKSSARSPKALQRVQAEQALQFYLKIAAQSGSHLEVRLDAAQASLVAGRLQARLGQVDTSLANFRRACDQFSAMAADDPSQPEYRAGWAAAMTNSACLIHAREPASAECEQLFRKSIGLLEALCLESPGDQGHRLALATAHHNLGNFYRSAQQTSEMELSYRKAIELKEQLALEHPANREYQRRLADSELCLSVNLQADSARQTEAERYFGRAARRFQDLIATDPSDVDSIASLAQLRANWAYVLKDRCQEELALGELDQSASALKTCLEREPDDAKVLQTLHSVYGVQAQLLDSANRHTESAQAWERVVATSPPESKNLNRVFLADALAKAGNVEKALAIVVETRAALSAKTPWQHVYSLAGTCGLIAGHLSTDPSMPAANREKLRAQALELGAQLINSVKQSVSPEDWRGLLPGMHSDFRFRPLLQDPTFRELVRIQ